MRERTGVGFLRSVAACVAIAALPLVGACALDAGEEVDEPATEADELLPVAWASAGAELLLTGLEGPQGSTVGPDGGLYVTDAVGGRILRINPRNGRVRTFASGLPTRLPGAGAGGLMDVVFLGNKAYALACCVGADLGGPATVGIYRIDGPTSHTVIADLGAYNLAHPPATDFFLASGVPFALEVFRGDLLVSDGHLNRVLRVTRAGAISEVIAFDNIVPTGLEVSGATVYMAEAGPVPHLPGDGKVVAFRPRAAPPTVSTVAAGAPLLTDVELGRGDALFALSQGVFTPGDPAGSPAAPGGGALVKARRNGTFTVVADEIDQPVSFELIDDKAYVVTLTGELWRIDTTNGPHHCRR